MTVSKAEVERAARDLRRSGKRVSVRNVRGLLDGGGSYSTIGPLLSRWKVEVQYRPGGRLPATVPAGLAGAINTFAAQVWAAAMAEAEKVVASERGKLELLEREHEREAVVAWSEVDRLEKLASGLRDEVRELRRLAGPVGERPVAPSAQVEERAIITDEPGYAALRGFLAALPGNLVRDGGPGTLGAEAVSRGTAESHREVDGLLRPLEQEWRAKAGEAPPEAASKTGAVLQTSRKFWDGVMQAAAVVLRGTPGRRLIAAKILARLDPDLLEAARAYQPLDVALLEKKMRERARHGRYFVRLYDGRFGLLGEGTGSFARVKDRGAPSE